MTQILVAKRPYNLLRLTVGIFKNTFSFIHSLQALFCTLGDAFSRITLTTTVTGNYGYNSDSFWWEREILRGIGIVYKIFRRYSKKRAKMCTKSCIFVH